MHGNNFLLEFRYIGGCCGFEAYHIRAISEELSAERGGKVSKGSEKHDLWGGGLVMHTKPWVRARYMTAYFSFLQQSILNLKMTNGMANGNFFDKESVIPL